MPSKFSEYVNPDVELLVIVRPVSEVLEVLSIAPIPVTLIPVSVVSNFLLLS